jgi:C4-type Zn-finger protein
MGYPFDTTKEYLMKLMQHEYCPCCGRRLDYSFGRKHMEKDSPSFDKIVPQRGYVTSNIGLLCHDCNYRKQNSTLEQLKQIVAWMESFLGRKDDADATDL